MILVFHDVSEGRRQGLALEQRSAELALAKSHLAAIFDQHRGKFAAPVTLHKLAADHLAARIRLV